MDWRILPREKLVRHLDARKGRLDRLYSLGDRLTEDGFSRLHHLDLETMEVPALLAELSLARFRAGQERVPNPELEVRIEAIKAELGRRSTPANDRAEELILVATEHLRRYGLRSTGRHRYAVTTWLQWNRLLVNGGIRPRLTWRGEEWLKKAHELERRSGSLAQLPELGQDEARRFRELVEFIDEGDARRDGVPYRPPVAPATSIPSGEPQAVAQRARSASNPRQRRAPVGNGSRLPWLSKAGEP